MPGRRQHLPRQISEHQQIAVLQGVVENEPRALLAGAAVGERMLIPGAHHLGFRSRDRCAAAIGLLQGIVAAAVIGMQMRIQQAIQRPPLQAVRHQRTVLRRMGQIAAVDQCGLLAAQKRMLLDDSQQRSSTFMVGRACSSGTPALPDQATYLALLFHACAPCSDFINSALTALAKAAGGGHRAHVGAGRNAVITCFAVNLRRK